MAPPTIGEALATWARADEEFRAPDVRRVDDNDDDEQPFSLSPMQPASTKAAPASRRALFDAVSGPREAAGASETAVREALIARVAADLGGGGSSAGGEAAGWALVSRKLEAAGFRPLTLGHGGHHVGMPLGGAAGAAVGVPSSAAARCGLLDVLSAYESRGRTLESAALEAGSGRSRAAAGEEVVRRAEARCAEMGRAVGGLERQLVDARDALHRAREGSAQSARGGGADLRALKSKNAALGLALKQKEAEVQRMQERLQREVVERETSRRERERTLFAEAHSRSPRPASASDSRALELFSAYESGRRNLQSEIEFLRAEVRAPPGVARRIYRRGFRDLEFCVISALGYAQIWGTG